MSINIVQQFMTQNRCYTNPQIIAPKGIMLHSTGTPQPDPQAYINYWNEPRASVCVHAFVHQDGIVQSLPWGYKAWHAGGSANNTHVGIEVCEPSGFTYGNGAEMIGYDADKNKKYFDTVYDKAVKLSVFLCKKFDLAEKDIICHSEGYRLGIASNHGDVEHWFPKHGKTMDCFRSDVKAELDKDKLDNEPDSYAEDAVKWAIENGILKGNEYGNYMLRQSCTRQDMLVFLHRAKGGG